MSKPVLLISCPIKCRAGYGDHSRDLVWALREMDMFDIKILNQPWGQTPMTALEEGNEFHHWIEERILRQNLNQKPEVWIQVTVPNEFQPLGKYNIGITAGIESTAVAKPWIDGMNRMDLNIVPSQHAKNAFLNTKYNAQQNGQNIAEIKVQKPIEVLFEGFNENVFKKIVDDLAQQSIDDALQSVKQNWAFLFVGHWLKGEFGHDRKDVATLIETFFEAFKNTSNPPALILKTSHATPSIIDREQTISKIEMIKSKFTGKTPPVYLIHGELTEAEMNALYRHKKVKAMVSFTKGEGFGRPLLEFSLTGKPVIASNFSGHLDFLDADKAVLLGGEMKAVHKSAVWKDVLIPESGWFYVNKEEARKTLKDVFKHYKKYLEKSRKLGVKNNKKFSLTEMKNQFKELLDDNLPEFPKEVKLDLPNLPTLKKID